MPKLKIGWKCRSPIRVAIRGEYHQELACNRCLPCLIRKERSWVLRQKLEALSASSTYFVTLTYSDQHRLGSLHYEHIQKFLRLLRRSQKKARVRFFCSGEYGEKNHREHWHLNIFSTAPLPFKLGRSATKLWPHGAIFVGTLTTASMGYVAKYVIEGNPQIVQASRKPGIGVDAIRSLARRMCKIHDELQAVPTTLQMGAKLYPLHRTLRDHFADAFLRAGGTINVDPSVALRIYTDTPERLRQAIKDRGSQSEIAAVELKTIRWHEDNRQ